jgi:hypothetical protein
MFRSLNLVALTFVAAARAVPIAEAVTDPSGRQAVDPLAVSYLRGHGFSPGQIKVLVGQADPIDPLAVSYLRGHGLAPSQIEPWTTGACSRQIKPAVCLSSAETAAVPAQVVPSGGFDWADAGIGAGAMLGLVLLLAGLGAALVVSRQNTKPRVAGM